MNKTTTPDFLDKITFIETPDYPINPHQEAGQEKATYPTNHPRDSPFVGLAVRHCTSVSGEPFMNATVL